MRKRPIIATNQEIEPEMLEKLKFETKGDYDIFGIEEIGKEDLDRIEILMIAGWKTWPTIAQLERMPGLRMIQNFSAGVEHVNFKLLPENVIVCGNVGVYSEAIAEHVFGMILYVAKDFKINHERLARGEFQRTPTIFLRGKTIGILGTGGIGQAVARIAKSFGIRTIGMNRSGVSSPVFDTVLITRQIDEILKVSELIVICLPLNTQTRGLITHQKLTLLREDCIFVNVGRAAIVDEKALFDHLKSHPRFKAAIDVWWNRPSEGETFSQSYPFFDLPNFLGSPNNAGFVRETRKFSSRGAVENVVRFLKGEPISGVARREDYI